MSVTLRFWPFKLLTVTFVAAKAAELPPFDQWSWWACFTPLLVLAGLVVALFALGVFLGMREISQRAKRSKK